MEVAAEEITLQLFALFAGRIFGTIRCGCVIRAGMLLDVVFPVRGLVQDGRGQQEDDVLFLLRLAIVTKLPDLVVQDDLVLRVIAHSIIAIVLAVRLGVFAPVQIAGFDLWAFAVGQFVEKVSARLVDVAVCALPCRREGNLLGELQGLEETVVVAFLAVDTRERPRTVGGIVHVHEREMGRTEGREYVALKAAVEDVRLVLLGQDIGRTVLHPADAHLFPYPLGFVEGIDRRLNAVCTPLDILQVGPLGGRDARPNHGRLAQISHRVALRVERHNPHKGGGV